ncbi:MAG: non-canonical purine NTP diphosphatase [Prevotella sp.]|nr:non-canonical purine NTP diphosphatase [Prevotella sp.]MBR1401007.1 non-canonical purine NTP diphosphatase [Prevotella sp.]MBR1464262.1 non-canonical purine NTP diphosphatase [Prevotella sp.]
MKIVFATNNQHKLDEIRSILGNSIEVLSLKDIGCDVDIPETADTLEGNALQKAQYVHHHYHLSCFADDTGLEVEALNGEPGVHSARYAEGTDHNSEANMQKLLMKLQNEDHRNARFRTVIALIENGNADMKLFEGIVNGCITREKSGAEGFGYDPIFQPDGYDHTFAELGMDIKNAISHRARAVKKLAEYLSEEARGFLEARGKKQEARE